MRGSDKQTGSLFSYVDLEERVPARHPLRKIKSVVDAALVSLDADRAAPGSTRQITLGADKGYDERGFVASLRRMCVTPHVAAKARHSAIDGRTTRHAGYRVSQRKRKLVEEPFGWGKVCRTDAKTMLRGLDRAVRPASR